MNILKMKHSGVMEFPSSRNVLVLQKKCPFFKRVTFVCPCLAVNHLTVKLRCMVCSVYQGTSCPTLLRYCLLLKPVKLPSGMSMQDSGNIDIYSLVSSPLPRMALMQNHKSDVLLMGLTVKSSSWRNLAAA